MEFLTADYQYSIADGVKDKECSRSQVGGFIDRGIKGTQEKVLPRVNTYEQARNKALDIIGEVDRHTATPHIANAGHCKGKIAGQRWHGKKVIMRVDHDPSKGAHINLTDFRKGKGLKGIEIAIPFEGSKEQVTSLIKKLNSYHSLERARVIFEKGNNIEELATVIQLLKEK